MTYLFDTNILIHYLRDSQLAQQLDEELNPFQPDNILLLSVVTIGEIRSIAIQNNWGAKRLEKLESDLRDFAIIPVKAKDIIDRYAEIDAFSQGKLPSKPTGFTSRNMGKNDLWIAATASMVGAKLLTTDADFNHLDGVYIDLVKL